MININDLPDEILTHILSFLPIKHAFRTTIVSKKWQHLCHSFSVLNIDDEGLDVDDIIYWNNFRQFMNTVMFCPCSQYITLKSLHLECGYNLGDAKDESFSLNKWIIAAKQRGIEYINLHLFKVFLMPTILFCCETLVVLKLTNMRVAKMYRCSVDLPSLKTLDLNRVSFHNRENIMRLISGCPVLENLRTVYVEARAGLAVGGYFKPLPKLINADIHSFVVPLRADSNVQFLRLFEIRKIIHDEKINSYYKDFPVFGNLTELKLHWQFRDTHDWDEVVKMLQNCPKLQTLVILKGINSTTGDNWKYPYYVPECVSSHLTTCNIADFEAFKNDFQFAKYILQNARFLRNLSIFCRTNPIDPQFVEDLFSCPRISPALFGNLTELKLHWQFRDTHDWDEVVKMLQNCPKLQTLKIFKGINSTIGEDWKYPYYVLECVSSHLTTCSISDFETFKTDFEFAKYILQNARLLQDLTILRCPKSIEPRFVLLSKDLSRMKAPKGGRKVIARRTAKG